jgi:hypothetical protein
VSTVSGASAVLSRRAVVQSHKPWCVRLRSKRVEVGRAAARAVVEAFGCHPVLLRDGSHLAQQRCSAATAAPCPTGRSSHTRTSCSDDARLQRADHRKLPQAVQTHVSARAHESMPPHLRSHIRSPFARLGTWADEVVTSMRPISMQLDVVEVPRRRRR